MGWKRRIKRPTDKILRKAKDRATHKLQTTIEGQIEDIITEAQSRVLREIKQRQLGLAFIGVSICFALPGSILLSFAGVYVLIDILKLAVWMSYISVGGLFAIISATLLLLGRRQLNRPLVSTNGERHTE